MLPWGGITTKAVDYWGNGRRFFADVHQVNSISQLRTDSQRSEVQVRARSDARAELAITDEGEEEKEGTHACRKSYHSWKVTGSPLNFFLAIKGKTEGAHAVNFRLPVRYRLAFSTEACQCRERAPECHWANIKCNCRVKKENLSAPWLPCECLYLHCKGQVECPSQQHLCSTSTQFCCPTSDLLFSPPE